MKEQILKLRKQGKSYNEISKILGCSKSTISYHCGKGTKEKVIKKQYERRLNHRNKLIEHKGGKCVKCGYNKCNTALEFHHRNPKNKDFNISSRKYYNYKKLVKEVDKCDLLCANCHRELHSLINNGRMA